MIADNEVITIRRFIEVLYDELSVGSPPVIPKWVVKAGMMIPFVRGKANRYFKDRVYDISRARDILGYDPSVSTEDGLRRAAMHWKEWHV
jgi:nucleoside-diphosphate-sugar epimerase